MTNSYNDIIEQQIFEFARNDKSVPSYVDDAIRSAMSRVKPTNKLLYSIKKIILIILSLGIMATSVVFAKDIVKFFKSIFTNTTPGINSAIENGEVHNIDMDFVYSNDIGIKINSIVEDENVIDIAFVFDCPEKEGITNIVLKDFEVLNGEEVIADYVDDNSFRAIDNEDKFSKSITVMNDFKMIDGLFYKSILVNVEDKVDINNLKLNISQVLIYKDGKINNIDGNWNYNLELNKDKNDSENLLENNNETGEYSVNYNKDVIKDVNYEINDTNFIISIDFLKNINSLVITDINSIILKDELDNIIDVASFSYDEEIFNINLEFAVGKYNLPKKLNLYIKYDDNKDTIIEFYK